MLSPSMLRHQMQLLAIGSILFLASCATANSQQPAQTSPLQPYDKRAATTIDECTKKETRDQPQEVTAQSITVHVEICIFYSGDGFRPIDPKQPTAEELNRLVGGEVYFVAFLKDGSNLQNIEIKSDILGSILRSEDAIFSYDLYQGSPSDRLQIDIGVFDDDGWPSNRSDKLKVFQDNLGSALEMFPAAAPGIPFIQPILDLIVATVDFLDPDDSLISSKVFIEKRFDKPGDPPTWHLYHPLISTDNGSIFFTISPKGPSCPTCPGPVPPPAPKQ